MLNTNDEDMPARQRERRAPETKQKIADELKRAARGDEERKANLAEDEARRLAEERKHTSPTPTWRRSELLGINREKNPGIQGRPPWA